MENSINPTCTLMKVKESDTRLGKFRMWLHDIDTYRSDTWKHESKNDPLHYEVQFAVLFITYLYTYETLSSDTPVGNFDTQMLFLLTGARLLCCLYSYWEDHMGNQHNHRYLSHRSHLIHQTLLFSFIFLSIIISSFQDKV
jgi:hypothetical protein